MVFKEFLLRSADVRDSVRYSGDLVHESSDGFEFLVVNFFRPVVGCVVVGMESRVEKNRRDPIL